MRTNNLEKKSAKSLHKIQNNKKKPKIMTSWPWMMKDIEVAIADPMPLEHQGDERPSVKELIKSHRMKIDKTSFL